MAACGGLARGAETAFGTGAAAAELKVTLRQCVCPGGTLRRLPVSLSDSQLPFAKGKAAHFSLYLGKIKQSGGQLKSHHSKINSPGENVQVLL